MKEVDVNIFLFQVKYITES